MNRLRQITAILLTGSLLVGCGSNSSSEEIIAGHTATGALVGATLGYAIAQAGGSSGDSSKVVGAMAGASLGGLIGNSIGKKRALASEKQKEEARAILATIKNERARAEGTIKNSPQRIGTIKNSPAQLIAGSHVTNSKDEKFGVRVRGDEPGTYQLLVVDSENLDVNGRVYVYSVPSEMRVRKGEATLVRGESVTMVNMLRG